MPAPPHCICTNARTSEVTLRAIYDAVILDDLDRAIEAGLLRWNGCIACVIAEGLTPVDAERLRAVRESRLSALAARERYRARQYRLQQCRDQREVARQIATGTISSQQSALPSAAAAALARAKAKAAARAKS